MQASPPRKLAISWSRVESLSPRFSLLWLPTEPPNQPPLTRDPPVRHQTCTRDQAWRTCLRLRCSDCWKPPCDASRRWRWRNLLRQPRDLQWQRHPCSTAAGCRHRWRQVSGFAASMRICVCSLWMSCDAYDGQIALLATHAQHAMHALHAWHALLAMHAWHALLSQHTQHALHAPASYGSWLMWS